MRRAYGLLLAAAAMALCGCHREAQSRVTLPCSCSQAKAQASAPLPPANPHPVATARATPRVRQRNMLAPLPPEHREWTPPHDEQEEADVDLDEHSNLTFDHPPRVAIWIDGYGRRRLHIVIDLREERLSRNRQQTDETARLDPWHGYNPHRPENGY